MKKTRFTENQIIAILKEGGAGIQVKESCRKHGISDATFFELSSVVPHRCPSPFCFDLFGQILVVRHGAPVGLIRSPSW